MSAPAGTYSIEILPIEYVWASMAGFLRQGQNELVGRKNARGFNGTGYDLHVTGAVGEFIASIALDVPWRGPGAFRGADLVGGYQVRARSRPDGDLILHADDSDDAPFVLVCGGPLRWVVPGWIYGRDGKDRRWWKDPAGGRPAFFVPHDALRPIVELRQIVGASS